jgi:Phosphodiester glycosidase
MQQLCDDFISRGAVVMGLLILLTVTMGCASSSPWVPLGDGVERQQSGGGSVIAHRVQLSRFQAHIVSFATPTRVADVAVNGDYIATNAGFFDDKLAAMGIVVDDHNNHGRMLPKWGALRVDAEGPKILAPGTVAATPTTTAMVQGIPRLLVDGAIVDGLVAQTAVRTAVCVTPTTMTMVVTTAAMDATQFATHLRDVVQCRDALNLDGGPSTQLSVRVGAHVEQRPGGWGVPNMLMLSRRDSR